MGTVALLVIGVGLVVGVVPGALGVWLRSRAARSGRGGAAGLFALATVATTVAVAGIGGRAALSFEHVASDPSGAAGLTAANTFPVLAAAFVLGLSPGLGLFVGALAVLGRPAPPPRPKPRSRRGRGGPEELPRASNGPGVGGRGGAP